MFTYPLYLTLIALNVVFYIAVEQWHSMFAIGFISGLLVAQAIRDYWDRR